MIDPNVSDSDGPARADRPGASSSAFEGWNDAGDAATGAVEHLELSLGRRAARRARPRGLLRLPGQPADRVAGRTASAGGSSGRPRAISVARPPGSDRDVVLIRGIEPNMRWRGFCGELLELCRRARRHDGRHPRRAARRHPAHPADPGHRHRLRRRVGRRATAWRRRATRARPASSGSSRTPACRPGFPAVSFWAAVPHYVSQPPSPKATLALLQPGRGGARAAGAARRAAPAGRRLGARRSTRWPARTTRSSSTCAPSRSAATEVDLSAGQRRRDRPRVRALPPPPRRRVSG